MKRLAILLVCLFALPIRADIITDLAAFDENGDGLFDQAELQRYFLAYDPDIEKQRKDGASEEKLAQAALDRADDALTFLPCGGQPCVAITLDTVVAFAQEHLRVTVKATDPKFGWTGLGFERSVTDTPNPRQTKTTQPAIFSYRRDENATDRDSINIFGGARLYKNTWAIDAKASTPRNFFTLSTGIDFDLDGTKKAHENTIDFGVPLAYEWVAPGDSTGFFTGHVLTLTPKFAPTAPSTARSTVQTCSGHSRRCGSSAPATSRVPHVRPCGRRQPSRGCRPSNSNSGTCLTRRATQTSRHAAGHSCASRHGSTSRSARSRSTSA